MASTAVPTAALSSASASPSSTSCGATLYNIPVNNVACALPYGGNHTDILSKCCKSADVVSYADNCGIYCLAQDQTVDDLTTCLFQNGAGWADVFCRGTGNATATATGNDAPLASGASVVAASSTGPSATNNGASATGSSESSASVVSARIGMGVTGLMVSALLLSSVLSGTL
ncbi:unnamed protein product [Discula destructiva]